MIHERRPQQLATALVRVGLSASRDRCTLATQSGLDCSGRAGLVEWFAEEGSQARHGRGRVGERLSVIHS